MLLRSGAPVLCAVLLGCAAASRPLQAQSLDCTHAVVRSAPMASAHERVAIRMLRDEVEARTGVAWQESAGLAPASSGCTVLVGTAAELAQLPLALTAPPAQAESFAVQARTVHGKPVLVVAGRDERGVLFGAGALLRKLELAPGRASLPAGFGLRMAPQKAIRSHQLGYRFKNNTYDAWNLTRFEQQIRDLAIFGANTVQLIAPVSDDAAASPLSPAPPLETLLGISEILDRYGLNCDLYYPEMEPDYARAGDMQRELARFEDLVRQMTRLDALWIPGGDPGHTAPALLFPLVEREAAILHRYHPGARVYISAQGMDAQQYEDFYRRLQTPPAWLSGVFFGPQSRDSFETQRARIPASIPLVFYPDIGHTMHAQFPVPEWDPAFALTEGREPINPRPVDEGIIYRHFSRLHVGFVTYSEGVNDDVNKMLWSQWGWNENLSARTILEDYARLYAGPANAQQFAASLLHLEQNWRGSLRANTQIEATLKEMRLLDDALGAHASWRFKMALYRACYDAYLQERLRTETAEQQAALRVLQDASRLGVPAAIARANQRLNAPLPGSVIALRDRVFALGGELFHDIGLQLSTSLYGAAGWERGANLDRIGIPLNDRIWLQKQLSAVESLPETARPSAVAGIVAHYQTPADGYQDDLGFPQREPHLVRGPAYADDPEMFLSAIDGVADHTSEDGWNWAQLTYAEALYEQPLQMHYTQLSPAKHYHLQVVYAGEDYAVPLRLTANHVIELQPFTQRKTNPQVVEYDLPVSATAAGSLLLEWTRPKGIGGGGRGRQIAEVRLFPGSQE